MSLYWQKNRRFLPFFIHAKVGSFSSMPSRQSWARKRKRLDSSNLLKVGDSLRSLIVTIPDCSKAIEAAMQPEYPGACPERVSDKKGQTAMHFFDKLFHLKDKGFVRIKLKPLINPSRAVSNLNVLKKSLIWDLKQVVSEWICYFTMNPACKSLCVIRITSN